MSERALEELRNAVVTMVAVLASFFAALAIKSLAGLQADVEVMGVAVALTTARLRRGEEPHERLRSLVVFPVVAVLASEVGELMRSTAWAGDTLYVLVLSGAIWVRRFGGVYQRIGTLVTLPFIVVLIAPAPPGSGAGHAAGTVAIAAAALVIVNAVQLLAQRSGFVVGPAPVPRAPRPAAASRDARPAAAVSREAQQSAAATPAAPQAPATATGRPRLKRPRAWLPSSRMALQMAAGLGLAFVVGHQLWPAHWSWTVLTAYIVASGNRGRGDVVHKSGLRVIGAGAGAVIATLVSGLFAAGDPWALVVLFAVLAVAVWLRAFSYVFWAAGVTAMLAILYGYFGQGGDHLILERVEGIIAGALIAVACAWFIAPVKTADVLRRRLADYLIALRGFLAAADARDVEQLVRERERLSYAGLALEQIAPTLRAHLVLVSMRGRPDEHPHDLVLATARHTATAREITAAAQGAAEALTEPWVSDQLAALRAGTVTIRRALARPAQASSSSSSST